MKRYILLFVLGRGLCAFVPGHAKADEVFLLGQLPFTVIIHRNDIESANVCVASSGGNIYGENVNGGNITGATILIKTGEAGAATKTTEENPSTSPV